MVKLSKIQIEALVDKILRELEKADIDPNLQKKLDKAWEDWSTGNDRLVFEKYNYHIQNISVINTLVPELRNIITSSYNGKSAGTFYSFGPNKYIINATHNCNLRSKVFNEVVLSTIDAKSVEDIINNVIRNKDKLLL